MEKRVLFFDLLRCVAAVAVIAIHVLAPYRHELGVLPFSEWFSAVSVNGFSRWAVPVFIMITGALMLSDNRPFNAEYYVKRRLGKVLLPFIMWSLFYAGLSGLTASGYNAQVALETVTNSHQKETYYHLGFFYYFIPLYFVIPFLQILVRKADDMAVYGLLSVWLLTTLFYLLRFDGVWSHQLWLYSGYLLLGYVLYKKITLSSGVLSLFVIAGMTGCILSVSMVVANSLEQEAYSVGRWLSYKTANTVAAAAMIFMLCRYFGENLSGKTQTAVSFISKHSLGIYLLHPLFLWPMKELGWHQNHPLIVIPAWILISGAGALAASWLLSRSRKTAWLLP